MKKIFGFSLVEIVVALIIISVIAAALAPIITKKMKSNHASIIGGSGGTAVSDITTECSNNPVPSRYWSLRPHRYRYLP